MFDVNLRQQFYDRDSLDRSFQRASIVKLNLDEVARGSAARDSGTSAQSFAKSLWRTTDRDADHHTRAEHGCYVTSRGEEVDLPGENVTLVDAGRGWRCLYRSLHHADAGRSAAGAEGPLRKSRRSPRRGPRRSDAARGRAVSPAASEFGI